MEKPCQKDLCKVYLGNKITTTKQSTYIHIKKIRKKNQQTLQHISFFLSPSNSLLLTKKIRYQLKKMRNTETMDSLSFDYRQAA